MKTNELTLSTRSLGQRTVTAPAWMARQNAFLSELLECSISNLSAVGVILFALCVFATILLASDAVKAYGWASFTALLSINAVLPLLREFSKAGAQN